MSHIFYQKLPDALAITVYLMFRLTILFLYQSRELQLMHVMQIVLSMAPTYILLVAILHSLMYFVYYYGGNYSISYILKGLIFVHNIAERLTRSFAEAITSQTLCLAMLCIECEDVRNDNCHTVSFFIFCFA